MTFNSVRWRPDEAEKCADKAVNDRLAPFISSRNLFGRKINAGVICLQNV